jgi:cyclopropane fatty-acyl-phospholipid synthase-like methyltransferase
MNYDELYRSRREDNERPPVKDTVRELARLLPAHGTTVLDIGSGDGRHTKYLAERRHRVTAVDSSPEAIKTLEKMARKEDMRITPILADISDIAGLPDEQFAAVVFTYTMEDLSPPVIQAVCAYISDHVNPRGYLAVACLLGRFQGLWENARPYFIGWKEVGKPSRSKTHTIRFGVQDSEEVLLHKPEE